MSRAQLNNLGERLRRDSTAEADLRALDEYRLSFVESLADVRERLTLSGRVPTERLKSTNSIVEKLRRGTIQLTQIQDIAGCRIVVGNVFAQDTVVAKLKDLFAESRTVDRRARPSHGYRATHVIVKALDKLVEIQVRTKLQHDWAELSEKLSDAFGQQLKYGGGPQAWRSLLLDCSASIADHELIEARYFEVLDRVVEFDFSESDVPDPAEREAAADRWQLEQAAAFEKLVAGWKASVRRLQAMALRLEEHRRNQQ